MRPIRFRYRTQHIDSKRIVTTYLSINDLEQRIIPYPLRFESHVPAPGCKILSRDQWTVSQDKFKQDIYENDLIRIINIYFGGTKKERRQKPFMSEVWWHKGSFVYYEGCDPYCEPHCLYSHPQIIEIVGDVYNNPEILQKIQEDRK